MYFNNDWKLTILLIVEVMRMNFLKDKQVKFILYLFYQGQPIYFNNFNYLESKWYVIK